MGMTRITGSHVRAGAAGRREKTGRRCHVDERKQAMLAEFTIYPTDATHLSKDVARMIEILEDMDLDYRLGPLGTAVEGDWDQIIAAIHRCHETIGAGHGRVITTITIDDRKDHPHHLDEMVNAVEQHLGHKAKYGEEQKKVIVREL